jgi:hypothetical protein
MQVEEHHREREDTRKMLLTSRICAYGHRRTA